MENENQWDNWVTQSQLETVIKMKCVWLSTLCSTKSVASEQITLTNMNWIIYAFNHIKYRLFAAWIVSEILMFKTLQENTEVINIENAIHITFTVCSNGHICRNHVTVAVLCRWCSGQNDIFLPPAHCCCRLSCLHIPLHQSSPSLHQSSAEADHCLSENSFRNFTVVLNLP